MASIPPKLCIPLAYLTAYQMLTRYRRIPRGAIILVIGASGAVGTALLDLAQYFGLKAIGTSSAANMAMVERFGATAIDYRAREFVAAVRGLTTVGVDAAFDADRRRAFHAIFRLPRTRRPARRLRGSDNGGR
jgi:NADPH:quinone reductase-like Zn-dependent oxidoreductase